MKVVKRIERPNIKYKYSKLKRVAGYARVSTKQELQASSIDLQIKHYAKEIIFNPEYIFCGIYADHGKSGTSMKRREGFQKLLKKIRAGHIDLVLFKSISRFARNTVDALNIIQETRKLGVEFYFEKENMYSSDPAIDMILTMMASIAEAESESMSENIRWGYQKRAQKGKVAIRKLFGYDISEDKQYKINEKQANAVRKLFQMKLEGYTNQEMVDYLNSQNLTTTSGHPFTEGVQITAILRNEKYLGKIVYGKSFIMVVDHEKVITKNNGERPQYIISNHHDALIDHDTFQKVQIALKESSNNRKNPTKKPTSVLNRFVYSMEKESYIYQTPKYSDSNEINMLDPEYLKTGDFPRYQAMDVVLVLKRAINALGRNFSDLEARYDRQVDMILSTKEYEDEVKKISETITSYKDMFYKLQRKETYDSSDRFLMNELEDLIVEFSMEYVNIEDRHLNLENARNKAFEMKRLIQRLEFPLTSLTPAQAIKLFSNIVIINPLNYLLLINISGKPIDNDSMKKAATMKSLLSSKCKSKAYCEDITWNIALI